MLGICAALVEPISNSQVVAGDTAGEVGSSLLKYARDILLDREKAFNAARQVRVMADALVRDVEAAMAREGVNPAVVEAAASELGETLAHVGTALLIDSRLDSEKIRQNLIKTRPPETFYQSGEPELAFTLVLLSSSPALEGPCSCIVRIRC